MALKRLDEFEASSFDPPAFTASAATWYLARAYNNVSIILKRCRVNH
jgi:hypothetical protein